MSCPSAIYTVLTNADVAENGGAGFGSIVRRYGRNVQLDGQGINLFGPGYYKLDASLSFTPTATGPVTIQFLQDGAPVPGALGVEQGTAATPTNIHVVALLRNCGCDCNTSLSYLIDAAGTVANLSVEVEKR